MTETGTNASHQRAEWWLPAQDDPRRNGPRLADERATLTEYLRRQRETLRLKCAGLDARQLALRAVEPSTLSLLGLVRHLAQVERIWFRQRLAGQDVPDRYRSADAPDGDFDGALPDQAIVAEAWQAWRDEVAFAEDFVARAPNLEITVRKPDESAMSLREVLVHMIEEYARHNGHADLLRERIDGRIGM
ncbi:DinB family protein [Actinocrinis puniceicyclus]|uniref:DinB family protein n=1 Tax=Actinocrinis puniceicyclus TaxID=977794 RepID=A0A8J7WP76_9ACTN|nr:DinB family protein [Actinocrinis puniceicyclus]MBS2966091.1 DinB family protein [Actinocrinis puniceicyclus]